MGFDGRGGYGFNDQFIFMKADSIIDTINDLDAAKLRIKEDLKTAPDGRRKKRLYSELVRNTKQIYAMYELLAAKRYEKV
jgi:hypothetical protein